MASSLYVHKQTWTGYIQDESCLAWTRRLCAAQTAAWSSSQKCRRALQYVACAEWDFGSGPHYETDGEGPACGPCKAHEIIWPGKRIASSMPANIKRPTNKSNSSLHIAGELLIHSKLMFMKIIVYRAQSMIHISKWSLAENKVAQPCSTPMALDWRQPVRRIRRSERQRIGYHTHLQQSIAQCESNKKGGRSEERGSTLTQADWVLFAASTLRIFQLDWSLKRNCCICLVLQASPLQESTETVSPWLLHPCVWLWRRSLSL